MLRLRVPKRRKTLFERRLATSRNDPHYESAFQRARSEIDIVESAVRVLLQDINAARENAKLSKAALAERVNLPPETIRRLLTAKTQNPTAATLVKLARALSLRVALVRPVKTSPPRRKG
jgi:ribosome-binding protein aMBF1 (putative translation factor)